MKHSFIFYIVFGTIICFAACNDRHKKGSRFITNKVEIINHAIDSATDVKKISLSDLLKEHNSLDGKDIQTEGIVDINFEKMAICVDTGYNSNCFWLDFNRELSNDSFFLMPSRQKLVIKGTIDNSNHGHNGGYPATIRNVYYLKTK